MKFCLAQTKSIKGDVSSNIKNHIKWIHSAIENQADLIYFPELSLTGYEPELGESLATNKEDSRLDEFQSLSDQHNIVIGVGAPIKEVGKTGIGMIIFSSYQDRQVYLKQYLHEDELPYFTAGKKQLGFNIKQEIIAPAICYEALQEDHIKVAKSIGATIYMASVAKDEKGIRKAYAHFPQMAIKYQLPIFMSNCVGYCDNFLSSGQSAVWDEKGHLAGKLSASQEGILLYDMRSGTSIKPLG